MTPAADRRAPWRDGWVPFVLYPLLAFVSFPTIELLLWGRDGLLYAHDLLDIPRSGIFDDWLAHGPSLWNTHVASGNALLAQQGIGPLAIDVPLGFLLGPFGALLVNGWLLAAVAGVSMHLFLRDCLRLSTMAVLAGGILYTFVFWHPIIGFPIPAAPLLLWLAEGAFRRGPRRAAFVVGHVLAGAFVLYNGQSQIVVFVALLEFAYLWFGARIRGTRALAGWAIMWAAAFGLYAPVLLTQLPLLPDSQRSSWQPNRGPLQSVLAAAARLYSVTATGVPLHGAWGRSPSIYGTFYLGIAGLPLLASAVLAGRSGRARFMLLCLLVIPMLDILLSLAWPLQNELGPLRSFQIVRVRHLFMIPLVAVAAIGLDSLPGVAVTRRGRVVLAAAAVPVLLTALVGLARLVTHRQGLLDLQPRAIGWLLAAMAAMLAVALVIVAMRWLAGASRGTAPAAITVALLMLLAGERAVYAQVERLLGGNLSTWHASLDPTPAQQYLLRQPTAATDRVLTFGEDVNRMGASGLLQADGYQTIYPAAYQQLFGTVIRPTLEWSAALTRYFDHWGNRAMAFGPAVDPELVALLGVRWLYVRNPPPPDFNRRLYRGLPWTPTVPGAVERYGDPGVTVYEMPSVLPRVFLAGSVVTELDDDGVLSALADASLDDLQRRAWTVLPESAGDLAALVDAPAAAAGEVALIEYTPDRITMEARANRSALLVLTDIFSPGWVADVDGVEAPIHRVDAAFRGVVVPAGTHRVTMAYRPLSTYAGFAFAGASLLALAMGAALLWRGDRQRRDRGS